MRAAAPDRRGRQRVTAAIKLTVSLALMTALLAFTDLERLWHEALAARAGGLVLALGVYLLMILASAWRWQVLLTAQRVALSYRALVGSYLVATFFNNFLPSNIGGDVVRIADTAKGSGSTTVATVVVFLDRAIGLLGLLLVAAAGASLTGIAQAAALPVWPSLLWVILLGSSVVLGGVIAAPESVVRLCRPLRVLHVDWVDARLAQLAAALVRFRETPGALAACFAGAVVVQAILVAFYLAIARSLAIDVSSQHLAVIVPMSFVAQMVPVSVNGLGVREAVFTYYFVSLGLSIESALVLSLLGSALILIFSLSGAIVYALRR